METKATPVTHRADSSSARALSGPTDRMSRWRWLLFAAMARFEVSEEAYYRFPAASATPERLLSQLLVKLRRRMRR